MICRRICIQHIHTLMYWQFIHVVIPFCSGLKPAKITARGYININKHDMCDVVVHMWCHTNVDRRNSNRSRPVQMLDWLTPAI